MPRSVDPESKMMGARLKSVRIEQGLDVEDIVGELDIKSPSWYHYESGRSAFPYTEIPRVARALRVPVDYLIDRLFAERHHVADPTAFSRPRPKDARLDPMPYGNVRAYAY